MSALTLDEHTGTLRSVGRLDGFLTGPSTRESKDIALDYVRDHAAAFGLDHDDVDGLHLTDSTVVDGVEYLAWEQRYRGIPVADAGLNAGVTGAGRLVAVTGPPANDPAVGSVEPVVDARAAYDAARISAGGEPTIAAITGTDSGADRRTRFADGGHASLTLYGSGAGYRLAWRVLAPLTSTGVYDVIVDARSKAIVRRVNRVHTANAKVFRYSPGESAQVDHDFGPWLSSGSTSLSGPNVHAFADLHDVVPFRPGSSTWDLTPESGTQSEVAPEGGNFEFALTTFPHSAGDRCLGNPSSPEPPPTLACTWDPTDPFSWEANRKQSVTQLFYLVNTFHDHLRNDPDIAFRHGSFEHTGQPLGDPNGPRRPGASDPVLAQALDGADTGLGADAGLPDSQHRNVASFLTLPDGYPGLMQVTLWQPPFGGYDAANDASVVFHEYAHGLSDRLVKDAAGYGALNTVQAGALAEGFSDFYAMDYLEQQELEIDDEGVADVSVGRYLDNGTGVLFRFQAIDCQVTSPEDECRAGTGSAGPGGFTYADFGKVDEDGAEVHGDGEIWAQTLWSLRSALLAEYGRDQNNPQNGIARTRNYVTQGMRLSPPDPSFLEMRNAILEASPDDDDDLLWQVFASRGMGYLASTDGSTDETPVADTTVPPPLSVTTGEVLDLGPTSAKLTGSVTPHGGPTQIQFEYGLSSAYGTSAAAAPLRGSTTQTAVSVVVTGLQPSTPYHFRVVAIRGSQRVEGGDATFVTAPPPPPDGEGGGDGTGGGGTTTTPPPPPSAVIQLPPVAITTQMDLKLTANRKGYFKVKTLFGTTVPAGNARFTVKSGTRRLARASTPVRQGRTVTKTLRLSRKGRRAIKPGRTKKVKLQLKLPGGAQFEKTLKLTRKRR